MVRKKKEMRGPDGKGSEDIDEADDELADHGGQKGRRKEGERTRGKGPGPSEKGKLKREGTERWAVHARAPGGGLMRVILVCVGGRPLGCWGDSKSALPYLTLTSKVQGLAV